LDGFEIQHNELEHVEEHGNMYGSQKVDFNTLKHKNHNSNKSTN